MTKCKACYKSLAAELIIEESSATTDPIMLDDISWSDGFSELEAAAAKPHRDGQCMMTHHFDNGVVITMSLAKHASLKRSGT